ncbi:glycosyltransferase family 2 protein [Kiloniella antarctica]|uniref:Glycosyltransferase family 2 protein n=1 Tax=Kiloniella antarctica TaxID=1550907 RepID=A0ABW5BPP3_9PROT
MFSINPYENNANTVSENQQSLKALVSQFSGKSKLVISDKFLSSSALITNLNTEKDRLEEWTFLSVEESDLENKFNNQKFLSVKDQFGIVPPFMPLKSYCLFRMMLQLKPNLVIVEGSPALGYFALLSSNQGSFLADTSFVLNEPISLAYVLEKEKRFPTGRTDIELNAIEKDAFNRYDLVVDNLPIQFLEWANSAGWIQSNGVSNTGNGNIVKEQLATSLYKGDGARDFTSGPLISICVTTFNRPELLAQALESLERQSYRTFEVIVIDDGSDPQYLPCLKKLEKEYIKLGWKFYYCKNKGPAAARNFAAGKSRGSHLLFMDDDNWALVNELACFVQAIQHSNADVFTCIPGWHPNSDLSAGTSVSIQTEDPKYPNVFLDWLPLGGYSDLGVFINCFGDTNALYKKDVFEKLGGYNEDRTFILEDMEFFTRVVNEGYRLEVVPEILFLYRKHKQSRSALERPIFVSQLNTLSSYSKLVPEKLWPLLICLRKGFYDRHGEIRDLLSNECSVEKGEWVELERKNNKLSIFGGSFEEVGWLPDENSKLSFTIGDPGRNCSLLFECSGRGILEFSIAEKKYSIVQPSEQQSIIMECSLFAGALSSNGETTIKFITNVGLSIHRFAVMQ